MNQLYQLNMGHLVLNPHPNDLNAFTEFIPEITEWIESKKAIKFFSISIEYGKDNNKSNKHLDIILFAKSDLSSNIMNNKGKQVGLRGIIEKYKNKNMLSTKMEGKYGLPYYCFKNIKLETYQYSIGYNFKENPEQNWNNLPLTSEEIQDCVNKYKNTSLEQIQSQLDNYMDIVPLNPRNATNLLLNFISEQKLDPEDIYTKLQIISMKKGYCWIGLSKSQIQRLLLQIKIMRNEADEDEEASVIRDQIVIQSDSEKQLYNILELRYKENLERYVKLYENNLLKSSEILKLTGYTAEELRKQYFEGPAV